MAWIRLCIIQMFFSLALLSTSSGDDFFQCKDAVKKWAESSTNIGTKEDRLNMKDLLFFLHVPRTGGRTYFQCFLRKLYTSSHECPRSYDKLHFDPSKPNCRLVVTHDDYSLMSKLPEDMTSVVTILRNPVDRVFSTYEFSVEVAARFLVHPNLTSALETSKRLQSSATSVSTLDIWPWKYLVPWMRDDLFARRVAREVGEVKEAEVSVNPYDIEDVVMPLHAYIEDPIAQDIIHNGATFQVAGLTNNSYLSESHEVRWCVRKFPELGKVVLDVAKSRLDHMLYIGLTEEHKKSATIFANLVGAQVLSQLQAWNSQVEQDVLYSPETNSSFLDPELAASNGVQDAAELKSASKVPAPANLLTMNRNMTVEHLMEVYGKCITPLRKKQLLRSRKSFKQIPSANFTKEARHLVPEKVVQKILSLNSLDVELYKHAQEIFLRQEEHLMLTRSQLQKNFLPEEEECTYWCSPWTEEAWLATMVVLFIVIFFVSATARRRTSKLKV